MELKVAVLDVAVYEDDRRKVECIHVRKGHFALRLTNKDDGGITKFGLSRTAAEQISIGFQKILSAKPRRIKSQKFIMDEAPEFVWQLAKP